MSIEDIIRAWKTDEEALEPSPVGRELTKEELLEITGGSCPAFSNKPLCDVEMCTSVYCADNQVTCTFPGTSRSA